MSRHLLVPGRGVPRPEHWMQRWADANPHYRWAPRPPGPPFDVEFAVGALQKALAESSEPAILVAHSAGCLAVATWAARHEGPIQAALLVAPPYVPEVPVRRDALPFRTIMVASRNDQWATFAQSEEFAAMWSAELIDAGEAGHLDTAGGYGPWPAGEELLARLQAGQ